MISCGVSATPMSRGTSELPRLGRFMRRRPRLDSWLHIRHFGERRCQILGVPSCSGKGVPPKASRFAHTVELGVAITDAGVVVEEITVLLGGRHTDARPVSVLRQDRA